MNMTTNTQMGKRRANRKEFSFFEELNRTKMQIKEQNYLRSFFSSSFKIKTESGQNMILAFILFLLSPTEQDGDKRICPRTQQTGLLRNKYLDHAVDSGIDVYDDLQKREELEM